jgi:hypothetical protein
MEHYVELWSYLVDSGDWSLLELTGFRTDGNLSLWHRPNDQFASTAGSS